MAGGLVMPAGVFVFRVIATADLTADHTLAQMYPRITQRQAFLAALNSRRDGVYQIEVCALRFQSSLLTFTGLQDIDG
jgi:hypothetical protein